MKNKIYIFLLTISFLTNLNADVKIDIIKNDKLLKEFKFTNDELLKENNTEYFEYMNIINEKNNEVILEKFYHGIKINIKKEKEIYKMKVSYVIPTQNFSNKQIKINNFQKVSKLEFMKEKTNEFSLEVLNRREKIIIDLGSLYKITFIEE